jgi:hypothetical protein
MARTQGAVELSLSEKFSLIRLRVPRTTTDHQRIDSHHQQLSLPI